VAEALTRLGTPFIFTTGCGRAGLPEAFLDRPIVEKPFYIEEILQTLRGALTSAGAVKLPISLILTPFLSHRDIPNQRAPCERHGAAVLRLIKVAFD